MADLPKWQNFLAVPLGSSWAFDKPILFSRMMGQATNNPNEKKSIQVA
jgi:hypothetical protein